MIKVKRNVFLLVLVLSIFSVSLTAFAADTVKGISVTGVGAIKVKPDIATLSIGVTTDNADAGKAQEANTLEMNKVLKALKDNGVTEKDIQTSYFSIYPKYDYSYSLMKEYSEPSISGYTVTNSINVTIRDIDKVGGILDAAIKAGANYGGNVSFSISDDSKYYSIALDLAVKNAKSKADVIAKSIGVSIGAPAYVSESGYYRPVTYSDYSYNTALSVSMDAGSVPISKGDLEVTATVVILYEY